MKQLASLAGVATGTIYLYFKDRDDLIGQLREHILQDIAAQIFAGHDSRQPLYQQYRLIWLSLWAYFQRFPDRVLCKNQFDQLPPEVQLQQHIQAKQHFSPLVEVFNSGREQGLLKPLSDETLACLSIEACALLAQKQILGLLTVDDDNLESVVAASWDAIAINSEFKS